MCHLYKAPCSSSGIDRARHDLFQKGKRAIDMLPPTSDALALHLARANHQAKVWLLSDKVYVNESPEETGGWKVVDQHLVAVWQRKPPVPQSCLELITCGCRTKCRTHACSCLKNGLPCIPACGCNADGCLNTAGMEHDQHEINFL